MIHQQEKKIKQLGHLADRRLHLVVMTIVLGAFGMISALRRFF